MVKKVFSFSTIITLTIYVAAQLTGLFFSISFKNMNIRAFSTPGSIWNSVFYIVLMLVVTGLILFIARYNLEKYIKYFIQIGLGVSILFIIYLLLFYWFPILYYMPLGFYIDVDFISSTIITVFMISLLILYPEWYIVNIVGFLAASGIIAIIGVSFGLLPSLILLLGLAIYDAISVYVTKHMITLAEIMSDMKVPGMVVVPKSTDYSFIDDNEPLKEKLKSGKERESLIMGVGDIAIPGILVVSAYSFLPANLFYNMPTNLLVAVLTIGGSVIGFILLMYVGRNGNPQAGLPFLNGGALSAFIISMFYFYHTFVYIL